jgi:glycosyltransferase involved in cell wall biosynthesis
VHILFLSRWFPYPADNGSKIRILGLLQQLARRHSVSLLSFLGPDEPEHAHRVAALQEYCDQVEVVPYHDFQPRSARALAGFFSPRPRFLVDTYHPEMASAVARAARTRTYDLVVASQLDMAPYALGQHDTPAILEELELASFREPRTGGSVPARWRAALTWWKLKTYLRRILPHFGACTVASEEERGYLDEVVPRLQNVHVIPNGIDLSRYTCRFGPPELDTLVYSGALTYAANYDAVLHFACDILPLVRQAHPSARLRVTGAHKGVALDAITRPGVELTGYLDDIRPTIAQSWAGVAPLRRGGGTRLKILEAMALGTPVIATPKGAEGLEVRDGEHALIASDPRAFAAKVTELLGSPDLRRRLAENGQALVREKYDIRSIGERLSQLIEGVTEQAQSIALGTRS